MLTHRNLLFQTQAYFADIDKLAPGDAALHPAPLSHGSGLYGLPHFAAGAVNVIPESGQFEPGGDLRAARALARRILLRRADHDRAPAREPRGARRRAASRRITYGGAPMYVADCLRAIELFGPRLYQLFGQGEAPMTITGLASGPSSKGLRGQAGNLRLSPAPASK